MSAPVLIFLLVAGGLVVGAAFVFGSPIIAIPILLLLPGPIVTLAAMKRQWRQRQIARFREQAQAKKVDFDARDERTLV